MTANIVASGPFATPCAPVARRWSWAILRRLAAAVWRDTRQFRRPMLPRTCPICGYHGIFVGVGHPPRFDARCLRCGSRERHRLTHLWITEGGGNRLTGRRILHFAPEKILLRQMKDDPQYETADLHQPGVTHRINMESIALPDSGYDVVIAHHALEHITDDWRALGELFRILRPGGIVVLSVPINASRACTYENPVITGAAERPAHFSAPDHCRYYGPVFSERLVEAGFRVETFRLPPEQEIRYGLLRDEWLTIAHKPT